MLIPSDGQTHQPTIDGREVPVFAATQWAPIPERWVCQHRSDQTEETEA